MCRRFSQDLYCICKNWFFYCFTPLRVTNNFHLYCCFLWAIYQISTSPYYIDASILRKIKICVIPRLPLKVTSAAKRLLLKMCLLKHRLRIFLFRRKILFRSQDVLVFVFLTIPWFTKSVTSRWVLVHKRRCMFEYTF